MRHIDKLAAKAEAIGAKFDLEPVRTSTYQYTCRHGVSWATRLSSSGNLPVKGCEVCYTESEKVRKERAHSATQTSQYKSKCRDAQLTRYSKKENREKTSKAMLGSDRFAKAVRSKERSEKISKALRSSDKFAKATYKNKKWLREIAHSSSMCILKYAAVDKNHPAHTVAAEVAIMRTSSGVYKVGKARNIKRRYGRAVHVIHSITTTEYNALVMEASLLRYLKERAALDVEKAECGLPRGHGWTECFKDGTHIPKLIKLME